MHRTVQVCSFVSNKLFDQNNIYNLNRLEHIFIINLIIELLPGSKCCPLPVNFPVMHGEAEDQQQHAWDSKSSNAESYPESYRVPRGLRGDEDIGRHEVRTIAQAENDRRSDALRRTAAQVGRQRPNVYRHLYEGSEGDQELCKISNPHWLHLAEVDGPSGDGEADVW